MKSSYLHKSTSFILAILVLFSTLSLTVEKHFCGGHLIDVAVFTELDRCGGDMSEISASNTLEKSCCKDEIHVIEGLSDIHGPTYEDMELDVQDFVANFTSSSYDFVLTEESNPNHYRHYKPPNLVKEIYLLNETYLI